jgi:hypothetical protein
MIYTQLDNLMSILLNVGSPTLGAYSLLLSLLNSRWVAHRFSDISYPNAASAARILSNLQQVPLKVTTTDGLLASLIVLPENNEWWSDLLVWLDINYMYTWSFANVASIGWVIVAFSLTVVDTFTGVSYHLFPWIHLLTSENHRRHGQFFPAIELQWACHGLRLAVAPPHRHLVAPIRPTV